MLTNKQKEDITSYEKYLQSGGVLSLQEWQKREEELKVLHIVFEQSSHWKKGTFEAYLKHVKREDLIKEQEENEEAEKELTKEEIEFEEYLLSSKEPRTFEEWKKIRGEIR